MTNPILDVRDLNKSYTVADGFMTFRKVSVLKNVSFSINPGESVGLVGESGSGKTTLARVVMGILKPDSGIVEFNARNLTSLGARDLRSCRRDISIVYQNPFLSLNPRLRIRDLIAEPIITHERVLESELLERVTRLVKEVGLNESYLPRRIGELSGGQAQRVAVARALALMPKLVVLDEPTSALDVSVQAQILNLLADLQATHGNAYLFISHNLDVIRHVTQKVIVMEKGQVVEFGDTDQVLDNPQHAYTQSLVSATLSV